MLLTEDEAAKHFLLSILNELDPDQLRHFEIISSGGAAEITKALRNFPKTKKWFSLVGIYDGDMRGDATLNSANWPILFLPSNDSPEEVLRAQITQANGAELLAQRLGRERATLLPALDAAVGLNPHDWLTSCAHHLGISPAELIGAITKIYLTNAESRGMAQTFVQSLKSSYNTGI